MIQNDSNKKNTQKKFREKKPKVSIVHCLHYR